MQFTYILQDNQEINKNLSVGAGATERPFNYGVGYTLIDLTNPANADGLKWYHFSRRRVQ